MSRIKNGLAGFGQFVVTNRKPIMYIGGAVVLLSVLPKLIRFIKPTNTPFIPNPNDGNDGNQNSGNTSSATLTQAQANSLAEKLWNAMKNEWDNEQAIYDAFQQMQNSADVVMVHNAFGLRPYIGVFGLYGGEPTALDRWTGNYDDLSLTEWLRNDTSRNDKSSSYDLGEVWSKMEAAGYYI
jgi:hypothetical protein